MPELPEARPTIDPGSSLDTGPLLDWSKSHFRDFPWRQTRDPFHVLVAEFMLRRTRANQVAAIYPEIIRKYPRAASVALDSEDNVGNNLRSLGLNWRILQFRSLCMALMERYDGDVPSEYAELMNLPGIGPYVASAIRVFAFGKHDALADANVLRFISRYFGVPLRDSDRRSPRLLNALGRLVPEHDSRRFWWAIIDLAAEVCTVRNPKHEICPLVTSCAFVRAEGASGKEPVR